MTSTGDVLLDVEGRQVQVSSLDRVLWPATGTTKADLVSYYVAVSAVLLPHLRDHPCALHRFPDGVEGPHFYAIRCPPRPAWVRTVRLAPEESGKVVDIAVVDDLATLVWTAHLSSIELHPYPGTADDFERTAGMVLDLDPGPPAGMREAATVALALRELLAGAGRAALVKTSGAKGLRDDYDPKDVVRE